MNRTQRQAQALSLQTQGPLPAVHRHLLQLGVSGQQDPVPTTPAAAQGQLQHRFGHPLPWSYQVVALVQGQGRAGDSLRAGEGERQGFPGPGPPGGQSPLEAALMMDHRDAFRRQVPQGAQIHPPLLAEARVLGGVQPDVVHRLQAGGPARLALSRRQAHQQAVGADLGFLPENLFARNQGDLQDDRCIRRGPALDLGSDPPIDPQPEGASD